MNEGSTTDTGEASETTLTSDTVPLRYVSRMRQTRIGAENSPTINCWCVIVGGITYARTMSENRLMTITRSTDKRLLIPRHSTRTQSSESRGKRHVWLELLEVTLKQAVVHRLC